MGDTRRIRGLAGIRCEGLLRSSCENEFEEPEKFAHLRADEVKLGGELRETLTKLSAARANVPEEFFALYGFQKFEGGRAGERTAAEGCSVHAGRNARSNRLRCKNRTERQTRGERLGDQSDVRLG